VECDKCEFVLKLSEKFMETIRNEKRLYDSEIYYNRLRQTENINLRGKVSALERKVREHQLRLPYHLYEKNYNENWIIALTALIILVFCSQIAIVLAICRFLS